MEVEKREEGLQKSLDSSNKGFALLAKMGYKAGESLGKSKSGRLEPIPIEVKTNRSGLGRDAAIQHIKETKAKLKSMKKLSLHNPTSTAEFRASQSLKIRAKRVESDLFNGQKACRQLDLGKEFSEPVEPWFWPKPIEDKNVVEEEAKIQEIVGTEEEEGEDENEEEVDIPPEEMLKILTEYLRAEYLFCIWCGITFHDVEDLNKSCPGNDRESHDE